MRDNTQFSVAKVQTFKSAQNESLLLNRKELAQLMGMSVKKAIELVSLHGVAPIDLGRGRGNGLRWQRSAVIEVVDILHTQAQSRKRTAPRKTPNELSVRGKTAAQLLAEFNGTSQFHTEVRNGN